VWALLVGIAVALWAVGAELDQGAFMERVMFKSKIHRATITQADVNYEGSITLDQDLLEAANMLPYEQVHVWNVTRGTRLQTYTLIGERGSGVVCINGAAAHLMHPGDLVIIATFANMKEADAANYEPRVVFVDGDNRIRELNGKEIPGPQRRIA
jgi:aspartate 1-decarboxylase